MRLITYEVRLSHVEGPEHDWWAPGDTRVSDDQVEAELDRILASDRYRYVAVQDDPHDLHTESDIQRTSAGLHAWCKVEGCTWFRDYA